MNVDKVAYRRVCSAELQAELRRVVITWSNNADWSCFVISRGGMTKKELSRLAEFCARWSVVGVIDPFPKLLRLFLGWVPRLSCIFKVSSAESLLRLVQEVEEVGAYEVVLVGGLDGQSNTFIDIDLLLASSVFRLEVYPCEDNANNDYWILSKNNTS